MSNPYEQLYNKSYENIVLNFWKDKNIYQKIEELSNNFTENFDNMDGPPFPNGDPHLGHMAIGGLKSTIQNHQRKMGKKVLTNLGFDCHGLPIESKICNKMNLTSNESIKQFGINNFTNDILIPCLSDNNIHPNIITPDLFCRINNINLIKDVLRGTDYRIPQVLFSGQFNEVTTLFVNAWDPHSLLGNGNESDSSLDGWWGRISNISVLGSSLTNKQIKYIGINY